VSFLKVLIGGNPLNQREDDTAIYTNPQFMPQPSVLKNFPIIEKNKVPDFITNLYFITMEKNGYSYFYPNLDTGINLCRFEWHYDFRKENYGLRLGLKFQVYKGKISDIGYYILPHKWYKDLDIKHDEFSITSDENDKIMNFIESNINNALNRISNSSTEEFYPVHYIELDRPLKETVSIENQLTLLPSRIINDKILSALIIPERGFSYLSCKRFSDERANIFCALSSLIFERAKLAIDQSLPVICSIKHPNKSTLDKNIENFYPNGKSNFNGITRYINANEQEMIISLYKAFFSISDNKYRRKMTNILFAYYSAKETININKTLSLVSYVSCLDSIGKECVPQMHKDNGSRKAIVYHINTVFGEGTVIGNVDKWSKRIYNDHRSSYVHGANIKFEEYSQNMDGKNFAGLPNALPSIEKPVSKQYEYENDLEILADVTRLVLLKYFESISGHVILDNIQGLKLNFNMKSTPEAHLGVVNRGWFKIS
jgi:hypothetical protein